MKKKESEKHQKEKDQQVKNELQLQKNQNSVQSVGDDFIFGIKSAFAYEEYEIAKTSKHRNK